MKTHRTVRMTNPRNSKGRFTKKTHAKRNPARKARRAAPKRHRRAAAKSPSVVVVRSNPTHGRRPHLKHRRKARKNPMPAGFENALPALLGVGAAVAGFWAAGKVPQLPKQYRGGAVLAAAIALAYAFRRSPYKVAFQAAAVAAAGLTAYDLADRYIQKGPGLSGFESNPGAAAALRRFAETPAGRALANRAMNGFEQRALPAASAAPAYGRAQQSQYVMPR